MLVWERIAWMGVSGVLRLFGEIGGDGKGFGEAFCEESMG